MIKPGDKFELPKGTKLWSRIYNEEFQTVHESFLFVVDAVLKGDNQVVGNGYSCSASLSFLEGLN